jgi:hypothetical protein
LLSHPGRKKVYYILKGEGWFNGLIVGTMSCLGWEFIPFEYELASNESGVPYTDIREDVVDMAERHIRPAAKGEVRGFTFSSEHEKNRIAAYIEWLEKKELNQKIEILHILELPENRAGRPSVVLLYWSRWRDAISARYLI